MIEGTLQEILENNCIVLEAFWDREEDQDEYIVIYNIIDQNISIWSQVHEGFSEEGVFHFEEYYKSSAPQNLDFLKKTAKSYLENYLELRKQKQLELDGD